MLVQDDKYKETNAFYIFKPNYKYNTCNYVTLNSTVLMMEVQISVAFKLKHFKNPSGLLHQQCLSKIAEERLFIINWERNILLKDSFSKTSIESNGANFGVSYPCRKCSK